MKNISKILTTAFFVGIAMTFSPTAEAQFLKKLSKGLEKINKTLEQVNNTASEILDGTALQNKSQTKAKQTESDANTVNAKSADNNTAIAVDQSPKVAVIDDSRWDDAEPVYNTPYITPKTRFLQIGEYDEFSDVHEGIFGIKKNGSDIISFWKITGEKLFDSEWKYCGHTASYHDPFPEFSGGVAPALRTVPNAQGNKVVCLLYSNGGFKELDPTWKEVTNFADGLALVTQKANGKTKYFYINIKGEKVFPHLTIDAGDKESMRPLSEGLRAYQPSYNSWAYIDANGKIAIPEIPNCAFADDFSEGYAWVRVGNPGEIASLYGYYHLIDKTGKIVYKTEVQNYEKVSKVKNGMFYVIHNGKYNFYDTNFKLLASYEYATPFHNGYAYVSKDGSYGDGVSVINTHFNTLRRFTSSEFGGVSSLTYQPQFDPLGLAVIKNSDVDNYYINTKGNIVLSCHESDNLELDNFKPFTESGYARFGVGNWGNNEYRGFIRPNGEIALVLTAESIDDTRNLPWPTPPVDSIPRIKIPPIPIPPLPWPPDTVVIDQRQPAIGPIYIEKTYYNVTVSTEGEGSASISPTGRFEFGDKATLKATPAKDWKVASVTHDVTGLGNVSVGNSFTVTQNIHLKVKFIKKDDDKDPEHTNTYQGNKDLVFEKESMGNITYYAQINAQRTDANPYGDNTYGFIVAMIDPRSKHIQPDYSCYVFSAPFRISGYQHNEATKQDFLVLDGGSISLSNIKLNPNGNGLAGLFFELMLAMNGFSQPTMAPRHYRLEMLNYDKETGEFTAGKLQTFSPQHGWLDGGDERLKIVTKGAFQEMSERGIPAYFFEGVKFKTAPKRTDIDWYPPLQWYENNQSTLDRVIEEMGLMYRTFKSDYDQIFND